MIIYIKNGGVHEFKFVLLKRTGYCVIVLTTNNIEHLCYASFPIAIEH